MTRKEFEHEMNRAKSLQRAGDRPDYWAGYIRGLQRGFHGEKFGREEEHEKWWAAADEKNASRQELGQGYRAGFQCATMGRGSG